MKNKKPLVSIMIPNRNHSMYLGKCIESALNQTYENIDIIVVDNCSNDNSIDVASKYIDKGVRVCMNPMNVANKNFEVVTILTDGKYMMLLCADDLIKPTFIEKSVNIMEKHPNVGYVHCERDYIDENDNITDLDPFYNCSFIAPGESALPIYMLTDVAQPAQCLMRRAAFNSALGYNTEFDHGNADIDLWFRLSLVSDYAYIREKLSFVRIHQGRQTLLAFRSFYHPLAIYLTLNYHAKLGAEQEGHKNVLERLPAAYRKQAAESLEIAFFCLNENNRNLAKQYMLFSQIMDENIINDDKYKKLLEIYNSASIKVGESQQIEQDMFIRRKRSYNPPEGFETIEENDYAPR